MTKHQPRRPLLIDTAARAIGEHVVLDIDYRVLKVFKSEAEAEAFVAEANGTDIAAVRESTDRRAAMLDEYRENMIRNSRPAEPHDAGD